MSKKRQILAVMAIVLVLCSSCQNDQQVNPPVEIPEGSFVVTIDNGANPQRVARVDDGMATKTTICNNNYVVWEEGDTIHVNGKAYSTSTSGECVVFSPVDADDSATGSVFNAFYGVESPANDAASGVLPKTQIYKDGRVSNLPMYATCGSERELTFHNLCAAFLITVPVSCARIKLTVAASEPLSGAFVVSGDTAKPIASMSDDGTHNYVELVKGTGDFVAGEQVYLAVPQGKYNEAQIRFIDNDSVVVESKEIGEFSATVNKIYNVKVTPYPELCFTALESATVQMAKIGGNAPAVNLEYRKYNPNAAVEERLGGWTDFVINGNSPSAAVALSEGEKLYVRAKAGTTNNAFASRQTSGNHYWHFTSTGGVFVSGNIMCLLNGENPANVLNSTKNDYAFYRLFDDMTTLKDANRLILPATQLSYFCYTSMFDSCTSLTSAPALPATTLSEYCYASMFYNCSSLTSAPELPAAALTRYCYASMFCKCSSLTSAPELPATTLNYFCYASMFGECLSLTSAPALPATTLAESCYANMFTNCTSLTSAPELPAAVLVTKCYNQMFSFCMNLTSVTMKATNVSAELCLGSWLQHAGTAGNSHILYVDRTMTDNATIVLAKENFTIQSYN